MNDNRQLTALEELETALTQLGKQTLPMQTRGAIQAAKQRLKQLRQSLEKDKQAPRLAALYRVSQSLGISLNVDEVLTQVMDAVIQLTGAERGFLTLVNPDTKELDLRAARNIQQENLQQEDMKVSRTVIQSVIKSGEGVVTTDAQDDPRFSAQESVMFYALRSILCAPLRARGKNIGVIYVDNRFQSGIFTHEDLDLLSTFATQAAVAIENAQLYTRTDQALAARVAELEIFNQIDLELNAQLDLQRVLEIIHHWIAKETTCSQSWIALHDEEAQTFNLALIHEENAIPAPNERVFTRLQKNPNPQVILATSTKPVYFIVPLRHAGKIIGAIIAAHPKSFTDQDQQFINRLAARASAAIENARLYQAVENANNAKSQFVSIVTHELRIPLTSIKGYADLIRQGVVGEVNEQQTSFLDVIGNNVARMTRLISDLSDISRIERGNLKLEPQYIALHIHVKETMDSLRHKLDEKSQSNSTDIPEDLVQAYADPNRVVQVLTNLVSNAWKYSPEGAKITIRAYAKDDRVCLEVTDTGFGISEEDQANLFTQFFRSESSSVREQTGWGLGLNVTQRLVGMMGGEIGFHSVLGKGSTFWFSLPTQKPANEDQ